jgi:hypothetical protein
LVFWIAIFLVIGLLYGIKRKSAKIALFFFGILNALHSWLASGFLGVFFYDFSIRL